MTTTGAGPSTSATLDARTDDVDGFELGLGGCGLVRVFGVFISLCQRHLRQRQRQREGQRLCEQRLAIPGIRIDVHSFTLGSGSVGDYVTVST
jgi:hypothetical protein